MCIRDSHKVGSKKILDWLFGFNVGPFLSGGSDKSPNAGSYSFSEPFAQTAGASMRRVVDFNNLNETQQIIPTGQSGLPHSKHYDDQQSCIIVADIEQRGLMKTL